MKYRAALTPAEAPGRRTTEIKTWRNRHKITVLSPPVLDFSILRSWYSSSIHKNSLFVVETARQQIGKAPGGVGYCSRTVFGLPVSRQRYEFEKFGNVTIEVRGERKIRIQLFRLYFATIKIFQLVLKGFLGNFGKRRI